VYVTTSGRLVVTRDNAKTIRSMGVMFIVSLCTAAVCGAVRLQ
jgi:hypothetical protein